MSETMDPDDGWRIVRTLPYRGKKGYRSVILTPSIRRAAPQRRREGGRLAKSVTCPIHGSVFSLDDGRVLRPRYYPFPTYEARIEGQEVHVASKAREA